MKQGKAFYEGVRQLRLEGMGAHREDVERARQREIDYFEWSEVTARLDPTRFTIRTLPKRLQRKKDDPLRLVLEARPDVPRAFSRLAERIPS